MEYAEKKLFSFISAAMPEDTFGVVRFTGMEGLSRLYEFEILVVSHVLDVPLEPMVREVARLVIHREHGDDAVFQGLPVEFEQLHAVGNIGFYRVRLAPRFRRLSLIRHNQIILDKSVPDFITDILKDGGLTTLDFEFRLQGNYAEREYVCQYNESHLDFISRWLEREGIYYFFEQGEQGEKIIFTDTAIAHNDLPQGKTLTYHAVSGLEEGHHDEVICAFACTQSLTPGKVLVKEYNEMKPSLDISGSASVTEQGYGQVYYYHDNFQTPEEGNRLARIRAEALACREKVFRGESFVPHLAPGFVFDLKDHFRNDNNRDYVTIQVQHKGSQAGYLTAGLQSILSEAERTLYYRNEFTAIASDVQFRPERSAPRPRISGMISAHVGASGSGKYAELDNHGRYRVILPFDLAGHPNGKGSAWVRMAQPYAGQNHGMHFPLHKGTEVLLSFIDGDPDRPIITGAVPNLDNPSVVKAGNSTEGGFTTAGGSSIHADDTEGSESIAMRVGGDGKSGIVLMNEGAPDGSGAATVTNWQLNAYTGGANAFAQGLSTYLKMFTNNSLTGFKWLQGLINLVQDTALQRILPLYAKTVTEKEIAEGKPAPKPADQSPMWQLYVGTILPVVVLGLQMLNSLLVSRAMKKALQAKINGLNVPHQRWTEILNNFGFQVASAQTSWGDGVTVQQGWGPTASAADKSINLICDTGPVMTYSSQDTHIVAGETIAITSMGATGGNNSVEISGAYDIAAESSGGNITMTVNGTRYVLMANPDKSSYVCARDTYAELSKKSENGQGGVVTCRDDGVTIQRTDGAMIKTDSKARMFSKAENPKSIVVASETGAAMQCTENNHVAVMEDKVLMKKDQSMINLTSTGITMKWQGKADMNGTLTISKTGKVDIG